MSLPRNPIILIPARMASTRLPNKPLADICGLPMIVQVWKRALEADLGPVAVAAAEAEIVFAIKDVGGMAVLTDPDHPSGSDRIFEALGKLDPDEYYDAVINVQGDLPTIEAAPLHAAFRTLENPAVAIGTLATEIQTTADKINPNIVKAVFEPDGENSRTGRALYFTRCPAPANDGPLYHHIGLYTYRRAALMQFVRAKPSYLEKREKLEQLRALSLGLRIDIALVDTIPLGVDTPEDLEKARQLVKSYKK